MRNTAEFSTFLTLRKRKEKRTEKKWRPGSLHRLGQLGSDIPLKSFKVLQVGGNVDLLVELMGAGAKDKFMVAFFGKHLH